jgi:hypothetical protein
MHEDEPGTSGGALPLTGEDHERDARLADEISEEGRRLVTDPRGELRRLEHVAQRGDSAATPIIAISGVALFIGLVFAIVVTVALAAYFMSR